MKKIIVAGVLILSIIVNLILIYFLAEISHKQLNDVYKVNRDVFGSQAQINDYLEDNPGKRSEDAIIHLILSYTAKMSYSSALLGSAARYISSSQSKVEYAYSQYKSDSNNDNEEYWRNSLEEFLQKIEHVGEVFELHLEKYYQQGYLKSIQFFILNRDFDNFNELFPPFEYIPETKY